MDDKEFEAQKARVQALIDRWLAPLYLLWYKVSIVWERERKNADVSPAFEVATRWRYMDGCITAYLPVIANYDDEALEWTFVHECVHILVNELRPGKDCVSADDWLEHEERVCSLLAKAFICVRDMTKEGKL